MWFCVNGGFGSVSTELATVRKDSRADVWNVSPSSERIMIRVIRSNEGLSIETSALESLYGGKITLLTMLIKLTVQILNEIDEARILLRAHYRTQCKNHYPAVEIVLSDFS